MAMASRWKNSETSPERTKVWTEPHNHNKLKKVPVVYYLCRNGQLEHPHFMKVPLSSSDGLYLRGMASMYSLSAKRSYRNGYVWHDLTEHDFIRPTHGQEYILKGSVLLDSTLPPNNDEIETSGLKIPAPEVRKINEDHEFPLVARRRNQSWSSSEFHEYKVYKAESAGEFTGNVVSDASTQTDDHRRRRRAMRIVEEEEEEEREDRSTELNRGEISPPPSDSSPETLETLMKVDGRVILRPETINEDQTVDVHSSGKSKTSSVLMQLLSSMSFKCGPGYGSLISHYKSRMPRDKVSNQMVKDVESPMVECRGINERIKMEDKEYFSGSLIEIKKEKVPALKRSSSYNVDRSTKLELITEKEREVKTKWRLRKHKNQSNKKEGNSDLSCGIATISGNSTSDQQDSN